MLMRWMTLSVLAAAGLSVVSCNTEESNDLAKAQACLDKVSQDSPEDAEECMQFIAKYESQQAQILKCSIKLTSGGLVESKVVAAFNALKSDGGGLNPTAAFLGVVALDNPNATDGLNKAKEADIYCQKTGIDTIKAISSLIVVGSVFNAAAGAAGITDPTNPVQLAAAIDNCTGMNLGACDPAVVGLAVSNIAETYCDSNEADADTCAQIEGAIADANGSNVDIGKALFCYLDGQTYNFGTGLCQ